VSISSVIPVIRGLKERFKLNEEDRQPSQEFEKRFKEAMLASLDKRFKFEGNDHKMATFLDPLYKNNYFDRHEAAMVCLFLFFFFFACLLNLAMVCLCLKSIS